MVKIEIELTDDLIESIIKNTPCKTTKDAQRFLKVHFQNYANAFPQIWIGLKSGTIDFSKAIKHIAEKTKKELRDEQV